MMSSKNSGFTASDIERYHSGQMSVQERHSLEKAALDDPFLADALEGYTFTSTPAADLAAIQSRLDEKLNRKRVIPLFKKYRWLSAAAVFVILAGAGWLAYNSLSVEKSNYAVAPEETKKEQTTSPSLTNIPDTIADDAIAVQSKPANPKQKSKTQLYRQEISSGVAKNLEQDDLMIADNVHDRGQADTKDEAAQNDTLTINRNVTRNVSVTNNARQRNISEGAFNTERRDLNRNQVMNPDPRANNISNSNIARNQVSDKDAVIEVAPVSGKVSGVNTNDSTKEINVVMKPLKMDSAEVVVVGYGAQKKSSEKYPKVVIDTLEPAGGYTNFDSYIASNIKMPDEIKSKTLSGEVQLAFDVDRDGHPTNITVVKSLCDKCDEEAIRLLKEGPKWKKKKNRKGKITIKF